PNPISHLDVIGAVTMMLFQLGWIRPIAIDPSELRLGRLGLVICACGSLGATLVLTVLLLGLRIPALSTMPSAVAPTVIAILNAAVEMSTWFVAFNLLPLPPLTGSHFLVAAHPRLAQLLASYRTHAGVVLATLILAGIAQPAVRSLREAIAYLMPGT